MISEEEYYKEKRLRKFWLILFPIFMLPGLFSLGYFILGLIAPDEFVTNPEAMLFKFTMTAFIPVLLISFFGIVVFLIGLKKSFFQLKLGSIILLVSSITFVPYTADSIITYYKNQPINYAELNEEELKELVTENNDQHAALILKKREEEAQVAYCKKLNNRQLYTLWKVNGDLKAYDEFNKRLMQYRVERIKYNRLSGDELLKKYEREGDQLAWFEIEARKRKLETGEDDLFE